MEHSKQITERIFTINFEGLFAIQKGLDETILKEKEIEKDIFIEERFLALLTEIGEMANETRCFKFWSNKQASDREVILEEYVDCLHFILSIGNYHKHNGVFEQSIIFIDKHKDHLTNYINELFHMVVRYRNNPDKVFYLDVWDYFVQIGDVLGFTPKEIEQAYMRKNEINYKRQEEGY